MANENKGITLAQIRSGAKEFVLDNSTVSDDIRAVQVALRVLGYQVGRVSFLSYMSKYVCTDCYTYAKSLDSGYVNGFCNTNFKKK